MDIYEKLATKEAWARAGGKDNERSAKLLEGKVFVRDRLKLLFDEDFDFEDGLLAGS
ncbi:MAG: Carboxylase, partial [Rhizobacter sp.]|nr:Carboxylase [Rhizobacter sp.]